MERRANESGLEQRRQRVGIVINALIIACVIALLTLVIVL
jgi:hypothetical protein